MESCERTTIHGVDRPQTRAHDGPNVACDAWILRVIKRNDATATDGIERSRLWKSENHARECKRSPTLPLHTASPLPTRKRTPVRSCKQRRTTKRCQRKSESVRNGETSSFQLAHEVFATGASSLQEMQFQPALVDHLRCIHMHLRWFSPFC